MLSFVRFFHHVKNVLKLDIKLIHILYKIIGPQAEGHNSILKVSCIYNIECCIGRNFLTGHWWMF